MVNKEPNKNYLQLRMCPKRMNKGAIYTSKIIKATALIADTMQLLNHYDHNIATKQNLDQARSTNIFGKASRSRVEDILNIFRQRYLENVQVGEALSVLVKEGYIYDGLIKLFYYFSALSDKLLYDAVIKVIYPHYLQGDEEIYLSTIIQAIYEWKEDGKTTTNWSEKTIIRVAQHILATLRDFRILEGVKVKKITPIYMPLGVFSLISLYLYFETGRGEKVLHHPDWKLFFWEDAQVERAFYEAHQLKLLDYQAAGSTIRLGYPSTNLKEYAYVILERAN